MIHLRQNQAPYAAPVAETPRDVVWLQRGTRICAIILVFGLVYAAARAVVFAPWFSIQSMQMRGDTQFHNALTIRANVLPQLSGNYFTLDVRQAQQTFEALPWIRSAVVQRVFPNQLQVHLTAHEPAARWETMASQSTKTIDSSEGSLDLERLVNQQGELFEASGGAVDSDALPALSGPDHRAAEIWQTFLALSTMLKKQNMTLTALTLDPFNVWQGRLDTEATLTLGNGASTEVLERAQRWLSHWPTVAHKYESPMQMVDLRYPQGFAVRMAGVTTRTKVR